MAAKKVEQLFKTEEKVIPCCYVVCGVKAMCRVWTKTGWANVCVPHYSMIEIIPREVHSPAVDEIRRSVNKKLGRGE